MPDNKRSDAAPGSATGKPKPGGRGNGGSSGTTKKIAQVRTASATTNNASTKIVTAAGAKVTTVVSNGAHHTALQEPESVTITADPAAALGISFAVGGIVRQVAPKGQVAALGVREGWKLTDIGGDGGRRTSGSFSVTATSKSKDVLDALTAIRKKNKPYTLGFSTAGAEESGKENKEEKGSSGSSSSSGGVGADGGDTGATGGEAGRQQTEESKSTEKGEEVGDESLGEQKNALPGVGAGEDAGGGAAAAGAGGGEGGGAAREPEGVPQEELPAGSGDGEVTLMYEMYDEKFAIKDGSVSSADIDETYCLSFVMPNCTLHLGPLSPSDRYARENDGEAVPYLQENPPGTFHGLVDGGVYWVYVSRDDEEEKQDRDRMKKVVQGMQEDLPEGGPGGERMDDGRNGLESCSCVYGNPCVDEYGCKDWHSRYAVAKANGWKGF